MIPGSVSTPPTFNFLLRFLPLAGRNQPRPSSGVQSFLHTGAVEKRLTVTSCCDSKPPGRSRQGVRERACSWVPCLPVRFGRVPGCVWARRAAHSWPGRRARRAPLRAAGCAGPERSELGEEPGPVAGALPVIGLLCCNFSRALRGGAPRRCPGKVCVSWVHPVGTAPGLEDSACLGGSLAVASPEEGSYARASPDRPGKCAVATAGARGVREETDDPRTLVARQSRARRGCEAPFGFPKRDSCRI